MYLFYVLVVSLRFVVSAEVESARCPNICPPLDRFGFKQISKCEGDAIEEEDSAKLFVSCFGETPSFKLSDFKGSVIVISNYYYDSLAARKESGVFAHTAQKLYKKFKDEVVFISGNKGADCRIWANEMANDAVKYYPDSVQPKRMPLVVHDTDSILRDLLFTPPYAYPSYVVLDGDLQVRKKFVGPCCRKADGECRNKDAKELDERLTIITEKIIDEERTKRLANFTKVETNSTTKVETNSTTKVETNSTQAHLKPQLIRKPQLINKCEVGDWSDWSGCSVTCGGEGSGIQFKWRTVKDNRDPRNVVTPCPAYVKTKSCTPEAPVCNSTCPKEIGSEYEVKVIAEGFNNPRDIAFHPQPGYHLGRYSEGRKYPEGNLGDGEAWVVNGYNHSVSIVPATRSEEQTTMSRRDRAYYHHLINATAISFNSVRNSGRVTQRDGYRYWAACNDNLNTYLDTKKPNFFMGPSLYDSAPTTETANNTVNRQGKACKKGDQCNFAHSDMLHEAPGCIGIVHDPELNTAFGNVYWAFDGTGNRENGQLVRFDFQQPHGPGSQDHSIASVRRYPDVKLYRGDPGVHAGMVVHPTRREIFIANPGSGTIIVVNADSGSFARSARSEYPIFSNQLPTFVYSIWECAEQRVFASGLTMPSGMALSSDGERLYVAEHDSGDILVYEVASAAIMDTIQTKSTSIEGMAMSPNTDTLYFVDSKANTLNAVVRNVTCDETEATYVSEDYALTVSEAENEFERLKLGNFSVYSNSPCTVDTEIPDESYFDEPDDTGFASPDPNVQGPEEDKNAYLLADRTDCAKKSELNFDQLLLGGFYCHVCLPESDQRCDGGTCTNIQWKGYTCDNQFNINSNSMKLRDASRDDVKQILLDPDATYRFDVTGWSHIYFSAYKKKVKPLPLPGNPRGTVRRGSIVIKFSDVDNPPHHVLYIRSLHQKAIKIAINFLCRDGTLVYQNDKNKDCRWLGSKKSRRDKLCKKKWISKRCPKTCKIC